jgi:lipoate-protein ligase A
MFEETESRQMWKKKICGSSQIFSRKEMKVILVAFSLSSRQNNLSETQSKAASTRSKRSRATSSSTTTTTTETVELLPLHFTEIFEVAKNGNLSYVGFHFTFFEFSTNCQVSIQ